MRLYKPKFCIKPARIRSFYVSSYFQAFTIHFREHLLKGGKQCLSDSAIPVIPGYIDFLDLEDFAFMMEQGLPMTAYKANRIICFIGRDQINVCPVIQIFRKSFFETFKIKTSFFQVADKTVNCVNICKTACLIL